MAESRISIANNRVGIVDACRLIGMSTPDFSYSSSIKDYCPFGDVSHSDGGQSKAFRIYPETNTCYCFACSIAWTPVSLVAMANDVTNEEAAEILLESIGWEPEDIDEKWQMLLDIPGPEVNQPALAEALKTYCARIDRTWEERQFDAGVSKRLQKCLELLPAVKTAEDADRWLSATKQAMTTTLGEKAS